MDTDRKATASDARHIDLTRETDVFYWCRTFDVTMEQLREAVQHAGHESEKVAGWLRDKGWMRSGSAA